MSSIHLFLLLLISLVINNSNCTAVDSPKPVSILIDTKHSEHQETGIPDDDPPESNPPSPVNSGTRIPRVRKRTQLLDYKQIRQMLQKPLRTNQRSRMMPEIRKKNSRSRRPRDVQAQAETKENVNCPTGFHNVSLHCYKIMGLKRSWSEAYKDCTDINATLPVVRSRKERDILLAEVKQRFNDTIWLDAKEWQNNSLGVSWMDDPPDLRPIWSEWATGSPNDVNGDCLVMNSGGKFEDHPCETQHQFVCTVRKCPDGYALAGRFCYKNTWKKMNYANARKLCSKENTRLPIFHRKDNYEIFTKWRGAQIKPGGFVSERDEQCWFGLTDRIKENEFVWMDGSTDMWERWDDREPNNGGKTGRDEDCGTDKKIVSKTDVVSHRFNDFFCDETDVEVICQAYTEVEDVAYCGSTEEFFNLELMTSHVKYAEGTLAWFKCGSSAFIHRTSDPIICQSDGKWNASNVKFECLGGSCGKLPEIHNGKIQYSSSNQWVNSTATYVCNPRHGLSGDAVQVCQDDLKWSGNDAVCGKLTRVTVEARLDRVTAVTDVGSPGEGYSTSQEIDLWMKIEIKPKRKYTTFIEQHDDNTNLIGAHKWMSKGKIYHENDINAAFTVKFHIRDDDGITDWSEIGSDNVKEVCSKSLRVTNSISGSLSCTFDGYTRAAPGQNATSVRGKAHFHYKIHVAECETRDPLTCEKEPCKPIRHGTVSYTSPSPEYTKNRTLYCHQGFVQRGTRKGAKVKDSTVSCDRNTTTWYKNGTNEPALCVEDTVKLTFRLRLVSADEPTDIKTSNPGDEMPDIWMEIDVQEKEYYKIHSILERHEDSYNLAGNHVWFSVVKEYARQNIDPSFGMQVDVFDEDHEDWSSAATATLMCKNRFQARSDVSTSKRMSCNYAPYGSTQRTATVFFDVDVLVENCEDDVCTPSEPTCGRVKNAFVDNSQNNDSIIHCEPGFILRSNHSARDAKVRCDPSTLKYLIPGTSDTEAACVDDCTRNHSAAVDDEDHIVKYVFSEGKSMKVICTKRIAQPLETAMICKNKAWVKDSTKQSKFETFCFNVIHEGMDRASGKGYVLDISGIYSGDNCGRYKFAIGFNGPDQRIDIGGRAVTVDELGRLCSKPANVFVPTKQPVVLTVTSDQGDLQGITRLADIDEIGTEYIFETPETSTRLSTTIKVVTPYKNTNVNCTGFATNDCKKRLSQNKPIPSQRVIRIKTNEPSKVMLSTYMRHNNLQWKYVPSTKYHGKLYYVTSFLEKYQNLDMTITILSSIESFTATFIRHDGKVLVQDEKSMKIKYYSSNENYYKLAHKFVDTGLLILSKPALVMFTWESPHSDQPLFDFLAPLEYSRMDSKWPIIQKNKKAPKVVTILADKNNTKLEPYLRDRFPDSFTKRPLKPKIFEKEFIEFQIITSETVELPQQSRIKFINYYIPPNPNKNRAGFSTVLYDLGKTANNDSSEQCIHFVDPSKCGKTEHQKSIALGGKEKCPKILDDSTCNEKDYIQILVRTNVDKTTEDTDLGESGKYEKQPDIWMEISIKPKNGSRFKEVLQEHDNNRHQLPPRKQFIAKEIYDENDIDEDLVVQIRILDDDNPNGKWTTQPYLHLQPMCDVNLAISHSTQSKASCKYAVPNEKEEFDIKPKMGEAQITYEIILSKCHSVSDIATCVPYQFGCSKKPRKTTSEQFVWYHQEIAEPFYHYSYQLVCSRTLERSLVSVYKCHDNEWEEFTATNPEKLTDVCFDAAYPDVSDDIADPEGRKVPKTKPDAGPTSRPEGAHVPPSVFESLLNFTRTQTFTINGHPIGVNQRLNPDDMVDDTATATGGNNMTSVVTTEDPNDGRTTGMTRIARTSEAGKNFYIHLPNDEMSCWVKISKLLKRTTIQCFGALRGKCGTNGLILLSPATGGYAHIKYTVTINIMNPSLPFNASFVANDGTVPYLRILSESTESSEAGKISYHKKALRYKTSGFLILNRPSLVFLTWTDPLTGKMRTDHPPPFEYIDKTTSWNSMDDDKTPNGTRTFMIVAVRNDSGPLEKSLRSQYGRVNKTDSDTPIFGDKIVKFVVQGKKHPKVPSNAKVLYINVYEPGSKNKSGYSTTIYGVDKGEHPEREQCIYYGKSAECGAGTYQHVSKPPGIETCSNPQFFYNDCTNTDRSDNIIDNSTMESAGSLVDAVNAAIDDTSRKRNKHNDDEVVRRYVLRRFVDYFVELLKKQLTDKLVDNGVSFPVEPKSPMNDLQHKGFSSFVDGYLKTWNEITSKRAVREGATQFNTIVQLQRETIKVVKKNQEIADMYLALSNKMAANLLLVSSDAIRGKTFESGLGFEDLADRIRREEGMANKWREDAENIAKKFISIVTITKSPEFQEFMNDSSNDDLERFRKVINDYANATSPNDSSRSVFQSLSNLTSPAILTEITKGEKVLVKLCRRVSSDCDFRKIESLDPANIGRVFDVLDALEDKTVRVVRYPPTKPLVSFLRRMHDKMESVGATSDIFLKCEAILDLMFRYHEEKRFCQQSKRNYQKLISSVHHTSNTNISMNDFIDSILDSYSQAHSVSIDRVMQRKLTSSDCNSLKFIYQFHVRLAATCQPAGSIQQLVNKILPNVSDFVRSADSISNLLPYYLINVVDSINEKLVTMNNYARMIITAWRRVKRYRTIYRQDNASEFAAYVKNRVDNSKTWKYRSGRNITSGAVFLKHLLYLVKHVGHGSSSMVDEVYRKLIRPVYPGADIATVNRKLLRDVNNADLKQLLNFIKQHVDSWTYSEKLNMYVKQVKVIGKKLKSVEVDDVLRDPHSRLKVYVEKEMKRLQKYVKPSSSGNHLITKLVNLIWIPIERQLEDDNTADMNLLKSSVVDFITKLLKLVMNDKDKELELPLDAMLVEDITTKILTWGTELLENLENGTVPSDEVLATTSSSLRPATDESTFGFNNKKYIRIEILATILNVTGDVDASRADPQNKRPDIWMGISIKENNDSGFVRKSLGPDNNKDSMPPMKQFAGVGTYDAENVGNGLPILLTVFDDVTVGSSWTKNPFIDLRKLCTVNLLASHSTRGLTTCSYNTLNDNKTIPGSQSTTGQVAISYEVMVSKCKSSIDASTCEQYKMGCEKEHSKESDIQRENEFVIYQKLNKIPFSPYEHQIICSTQLENMLLRVKKCQDDKWIDLTVNKDDHFADVCFRAIYPEKTRTAVIGSTDGGKMPRVPKTALLPSVIELFNNYINTSGSRKKPFVDGVTVAVNEKRIQVPVATDAINDVMKLTNGSVLVTVYKNETDGRRKTPTATTRIPSIDEAGLEFLLHIFDNGKTCEILISKPAGNNPKIECFGALTGKCGKSDRIVLNPTDASSRIFVTLFCSSRGGRFEWKSLPPSHLQGRVYYVSIPSSQFKPNTAKITIVNPSHSFTANFVTNDGSIIYHNVKSTESQVKGMSLHKLQLDYQKPGFLIFDKPSLVMVSWNDRFGDADDVIRFEYLPPFEHLDKGSSPLPPEDKLSRVNRTFVIVAVNEDNDDLSDALGDQYPKVIKNSPQVKIFGEHYDEFIVDGSEPPKLPISSKIAYVTVYVHATNKTNGISTTIYQTDKNQHSKEAQCVYYGKSRECGSASYKQVSMPPGVTKCTDPQFYFNACTANTTDKHVEDLSELYIDLVVEVIKEVAGFRNIDHMDKRFNFDAVEIFIGFMINQLNEHLSRLVVDANIVSGTSPANMTNANNINFTSFIANYFELWDQVTARYTRMKFKYYFNAIANMQREIHLGAMQDSKVRIKYLALTDAVTKQNSTLTSPKGPLYSEDLSGKRFFQRLKTYVGQKLEDERRRISIARNITTLLRDIVASSERTDFRLHIVRAPFSDIDSHFRQVIMDIYNLCNIIGYKPSVPIFSSLENIVFDKYQGTADDAKRVTQIIEHVCLKLVLNCNSNVTLNIDNISLEYALANLTIVRDNINKITGQRSPLLNGLKAIDDAVNKARRVDKKFNSCDRILTNIWSEKNSGIVFACQKIEHDFTSLQSQSSSITPNRTFTQQTALATFIGAIFDSYSGKDEQSMLSRTSVDGCNVFRFLNHFLNRLYRNCSNSESITGLMQRLLINVNRLALTDSEVSKLLPLYMFDEITKASEPFINLSTPRPHQDQQKDFARLIWNHWSLIKVMWANEKPIHTEINNISYITRLHRHESNISQFLPTAQKNTTAVLLAASIFLKALNIYKPTQILQNKWDTYFFYQRTLKSIFNDVELSFSQMMEIPDRLSYKPTSNDYSDLYQFLVQFRGISNKLLNHYVRTFKNILNMTKLIWTKTPTNSTILSKALIGDVGVFRANVTMVVNNFMRRSAGNNRNSKTDLASLPTKIWRRYLTTGTAVHFSPRETEVVYTLLKRALLVAFDDQDESMTIPSEWSSFEIVFNQIVGWIDEKSKNLSVSAQHELLAKYYGCKISDHWNIVKKLWVEEVPMYTEVNDQSYMKYLQTLVSENGTSLIANKQRQELTIGLHKTSTNTTIVLLAATVFFNALKICKPAQVLTNKWDTYIFYHRTLKSIFNEVGLNFSEAMNIPGRLSYKPTNKDFGELYEFLHKFRGIGYRLLNHYARTFKDILARTKPIWNNVPANSGILSEALIGVDTGVFHANLTFAVNEFIQKSADNIHSSKTDLASLVRKIWGRYLTKQSGEKFSPTEIEVVYTLLKRALLTAFDDQDESMHIAFEWSSFEGVFNQTVGWIDEKSKDLSVSAQDELLAKHYGCKISDHWNIVKKLWVEEVPMYTEVNDQSYMKYLQALVSENGTSLIANKQRQELTIGLHKTSTNTTTVLLAATVFFNALKICKPAQVLTNKWDTYIFYHRTLKSIFNEVGLNFSEAMNIPGRLSYKPTNKDFGELYEFLHKFRGISNRLLNHYARTFKDILTRTKTIWNNVPANSGILSEALIGVDTGVFHANLTFAVNEFIQKSADNIHSSKTDLASLVRKIWGRYLTKQSGEKFSPTETEVVYTLLKRALLTAFDDQDESMHIPFEWSSFEGVFNQTVGWIDEKSKDLSVSAQDELLAKHYGCKISDHWNIVKKLWVEEVPMYTEVNDQSYMKYLQALVSENGTSLIANKQRQELTIGLHKTSTNTTTVLLAATVFFNALKICKPAHVLTNKWDTYIFYHRTLKSIFNEVGLNFSEAMNIPGRLSYKPTNKDFGELYEFLHKFRGISNRLLNHYARTFKDILTRTKTIWNNVPANSGILSEALIGVDTGVFHANLTFAVNEFIQKSADNIHSSKTDLASLVRKIWGRYLTKQSGEKFSPTETEVVYTLLKRALLTAFDDQDESMHIPFEWSSFEGVFNQTVGWIDEKSKDLSVSAQDELLAKHYGCKISDHWNIVKKLWVEEVPMYTEVNDQSYMKYLQVLVAENGTSLIANKQRQELTIGLHKTSTNTTTVLLAATVFFNALKICKPAQLLTNKWDTYIFYHRTLKSIFNEVSLNFSEAMNIPGRLSYKPTNKDFGELYEFLLKFRGISNRLLNHYARTFKDILTRTKTIWNNVPANSGFLSEALIGVDTGVFHANLTFAVNEFIQKSADNIHSSKTDLASLVRKIWGRYLTKQSGEKFSPTETEVVYTLLKRALLTAFDDQDESMHIPFEWSSFEGVFNQTVGWIDEKSKDLSVSAQDELLAKHYGCKISDHWNIVKKLWVEEVPMYTEVNDQSYMKYLQALVSENGTSLIANKQRQELTIGLHKTSTNTTTVLLAATVFFNALKICKPAQVLTNKWDTYIFYHRTLKSIFNEVSLNFSEAMNIPGRLSYKPTNKDFSELYEFLLKFRGISNRLLNHYARTFKDILTRTKTIWNNVPANSGFLSEALIGVDTGVFHANLTFAVNEFIQKSADNIHSSKTDLASLVRKIWGRYLTKQSGENFSPTETEVVYTLLKRSLLTAFDDQDESMHIPFEWSSFESVFNQTVGWIDEKSKNLSVAAQDDFLAKYYARLIIRHWNVVKNFWVKEGPVYNGAKNQSYITYLERLVTENGTIEENDKKSRSIVLFAIGVFRRVFELENPDHGLSSKWNSYVFFKRILKPIRPMVDLSYDQVVRADTVLNNLPRITAFKKFYEFMSQFHSLSDDLLDHYAASLKNILTLTKEHKGSSNDVLAKILINGTEQFQYHMKDTIDSFTLTSENDVTGTKTDINSLVTKIWIRYLSKQGKQKFSATEVKTIAVILKQSLYAAFNDSHGNLLIPFNWSGLELVFNQTIQLISKNAAALLHQPVPYTSVNHAPGATTEKSTTVQDQNSSSVDQFTRILTRNTLSNKKLPSSSTTASLPLSSSHFESAAFSLVTAKTMLNVTPTSSLDTSSHRFSNITGYLASNTTVHVPQSSANGSKVPAVDSSLRSTSSRVEGIEGSSDSIISAIVTEPPIPTASANWTAINVLQSSASRSKAHLVASSWSPTSLEVEKTTSASSGTKPITSAPDATISTDITHPYIQNFTLNGTHMATSHNLTESSIWSSSNVVTTSLPTRYEDTETEINASTTSSAFMISSRNVPTTLPSSTKTTTAPVLVGSVSKTTPDDVPELLTTTHAPVISDATLTTVLSTKVLSYAPAEFTCDKQGDCSPTKNIEMNILRITNKLTNASSIDSILTNHDIIRHIRTNGNREPLMHFAGLLLNTTILSTTPPVKNGNTKFVELMELLVTRLNESFNCEIYPIVEYLNEVVAIITNVYNVDGSLQLNSIREFVEYFVCQTIADDLKWLDQIISNLVGALPIHRNIQKLKSGVAVSKLRKLLTKKLTKTKLSHEQLGKQLVKKPTPFRHALLSFLEVGLKDCIQPPETSPDITGYIANLTAILKSYIKSNDAIFNTIGAAAMHDSAVRLRLGIGIRCSSKNIGETAKHTVEEVLADGSNSTALDRLVHATRESVEAYELKLPPELVTTFGALQSKLNSLNVRLIGHRLGKSNTKTPRDILDLLTQSMRDLPIKKKRARRTTTLDYHRIKDVCVGFANRLMYIYGLQHTPQKDFLDQLFLGFIQGVFESGYHGTKLDLLSSLISDRTQRRHKRSTPRQLGENAALGDIINNDGRHSNGIAGAFNDNIDENNARGGKEEDVKGGDATVTTVIVLVVFLVILCIVIVVVCLMYKRRKRKSRKPSKTKKKSKTQVEKPVIASSAIPAIPDQVPVHAVIVDIDDVATMSSQVETGSSQMGTETESSQVGTDTESTELETESTMLMSDEMRGVAVAGGYGAGYAADDAGVGASLRDPEPEVTERTQVSALDPIDLISPVDMQRTRIESVASPDRLTKTDNAQPLLPKLPRETNKLELSNSTPLRTAAVTEKSKVPVKEGKTVAEMMLYEKLLQLKEFREHECKHKSS